MSNNPPDVILELTQDEADFLLKNCESNMAFALSAMQALEDMKSLEKLVDLNEKFKNIRDKLKKVRD